MIVYKTRKLRICLILFMVLFVWVASGFQICGIIKLCANKCLVPLHGTTSLYCSLGGFSSTKSVESIWCLVQASSTDTK